MVLLIDMAIKNSCESTSTPIILPTRTIEDQHLNILLYSEEQLFRGLADVRNRWLYLY